MDRPEAVMACVSAMRKLPRFQAASDENKAKAAAYAFDRLHEDALNHLPFGASAKELKSYGKAALKRVHEQTEAMSAAEFEQVNGFPIMLVLSLLPMLWQWWGYLKNWMGW